MMRLGFVLIVILARSFAFAQDSPFQPSDDEKLRQEVERLRRELAETRRQLEARTLEVVQLKLAEARRTGDAAEETRLLRDEALASPFTAVLLFGVREASGLSPERVAELLPAMGRVAREGVPEAASLAVDALSKLEGGEPHLLAARKHFDPAVRGTVAAALPRLKGSGRLDAVEEFLRDPDAGVRRAAADAAAALNDSSLAPAILLRLGFEADADVMIKLMDTLGALRCAEAVDPLLRALDDPSPRIVWTAINNLGRIGQPRVADAVEKFLDPGRPQHIRIVSAQSLGRLKTVEGRRRLQEALDRDADPLVREAAARALALDDGVEFTRLVDAHRREETASVRKALWEGLMARSDGRPALRVELLDTMIAREAWAEADEVCRALHGAAIEDESAADLRRRLERRLADHFRRSSAPEELATARVHFENLLAAGEPEPETVETAYELFCKLGKRADAIAMVKKQFERAAADRPTRWTLADLWMKGLAEENDPFLIAEAAFDLVHAQPRPPADFFTKWSDAYKRAAESIRAEIAADDAAARRKALGRTKELGKRIVVPLTLWLNEESMAAVRRDLIEAGNAIAGTTFEPTAADDAEKRREVATAWNKWAEKAP